MTTSIIAHLPASPEVGSDTEPDAPEASGEATSLGEAGPCNEPFDEGHLRQIFRLTDEWEARGRPSGELEAVIGALCRERLRRKRRRR